MRRIFRFWPVLLGVLLSCGTVSAADPAFSDRTAESGIDVFFDGSGYQHPSYTGGGAVGDFNRDGLQDVFVLDGSGRDYLYINNGNGTFTDHALSWGLGIAHSGKGASVGDINGDGWLDIFVTSAGPVGNDGPCHHKLYRNNGNSTFTEIAQAAGVECTTTSSQDGFGSTFGDYDLDGDLDLFVAGFASNNAGSRLFRNDGDGNFTDVTASAEIFDQTPFGMSAFNPRLVDMDGDDYPDLPLGADFGTSRYFRNERDGTFTDITSASNTSQEENGMGGAIGDVDNDGLLDWYVTSILLTSVGWTGNKLYMNQGNHVYVEVAEAAGVHEGGYGWAALAVDFNHDGLVDLLETNGDSNSAGPFFEEQSYLWINNGGTYTEMALTAGLVHEGKGRGMANLDYDNDGDQDVIIFGNEEQVRFYRNDLSGAGTNWLRVFLNTDSAADLAPGGTGARVYVTSGFTTKMRYMASGDNFLSHSELSAHFGLGLTDHIDELRVHWPGGGDSVLDDVEINRTLTLVARDNPPLCTPAPAEVTGLLLGRTGQTLEFTWTDGVGADDYLVLADSVARGDFILQVGSAVSGSTGVQASMPSADRYYLVNGRAGTCIGP